MCHWIFTSSSLGFNLKLRIIGGNPTSQPIINNATSPLVPTLMELKQSYYSIRHITNCWWKIRLGFSIRVYLSIQIFIKFRPWLFQAANDFVSQKVIVGSKLSFDRKGHAWLGKQFCEQTDKEEALIIYGLLKIDTSNKISCTAFLCYFLQNGRMAEWKWISGE